MSPACEEHLEVKCGVPPPLAPTCDAKKEACLFDILRDPCEFYNIAEQLPEVSVNSSYFSIVLFIGKWYSRCDGIMAFQMVITVTTVVKMGLYAGRTLKRLRQHVA